MPFLDEIWTYTGNNHDSNFIEKTFFAIKGCSLIEVSFILKLSLLTKKVSINFRQMNNKMKEQCKLKEKTQENVIIWLFPFV